MAVPAWFNETTYMANKLAQMQKAQPSAGWTEASLAAAFVAAGFSGAEGAYNHFVAYGAAEDVSPNSSFNAEEYYAAKAAQFNNVSPSAVTALQIASVKQAIANAGMNAWTHYTAYGSSEGVNPSNSFDESSYLAAKLAALQAADPTTWGSKTTADVSAAFKAAGMSSLQHFLTYGGQGAGEVASGATYPVPASEQVSVASNVGQTFTLTTGVDVMTGTAGNDQFIGTNATLTTGDNLTGGDGTDTLNSTFGTGASPLVTLNGIENVAFTSSVAALGGGSALNTGSWTGVQKISVAGLGQAITDSTVAGAGNSFVGLKNNVTLVASNMTVAVDNDAVMAVQFGTDKLGSTTATLALEVADIVGATADTGVASILVDTQGTDKITKLNVAASSGTSRVRLEGAAAAEISLTDITATGAGNLTLSVDGANAVVTDLANVNASAMTGKFTADVSTSTKNITFVGSAGANTVTFGNGDNTITGGAAGDKFTIGTGKNTINALAGNDTVTTALANLTTADAIDLGDGTRDAIVYSNVTALNSTGIDATAKAALVAQKNVEVIGSSDAVTAIDFGYLAQNVYRLSGNLIAAVTGTNVDGDTLEFTGNGITGVNGDALTVSGVLPNRTLSLEFNGAAGVTLAGTDAAAGNTGLTVSSGISTVNILSTTSATSTTGIVNKIQNVAATTATHSIDNVSAGTFVLTGNTDFTVGLGATAGFTNQVDFNASAFTGKLSIAASAGADVITGGTGNDTITALGGDDTIDLTAGGVDKLVFSIAATNGKDTITGFTASSATGADSLNIAALGDGTLGVIEATITTAAAQQAWVDDRAYIIDTTGAAGNLTTGGAAAVTDFTNLTQVSAYLAERFTIGAALDGAIVLNNTASGSTSSYVYSVTDDGSGAFNAADLTLVGVIDRGANTLIASNVVFA